MIINFENHCEGEKVAAVMISTYQLIETGTHRAVHTIGIARHLSKEFGLPGFWKVKGLKDD